MSVLACPSVINRTIIYLSIYMIWNNGMQCETLLIGYNFYLILTDAFKISQFR